MPDQASRRGFTLIELLVVIALIGTVITLFLPAVYASREAARKLQCTNHLKQLGSALQLYHDVYRQAPPNGVFFWRRQSNNNYTWFRSSRGSVLVKLLPFLDQNPLYEQLDFDKAGNPASWKDPHFQQASQSRLGKLWRSEVMPFFLCPSANIDPYGTGINPGRDPALGCYGFSIGAQRMSSRAGWCLDYPGNVFGTGPADHGNDVRSYRLSGMFARGHWAAKNADIEDGQSQVIAFGEILPLKSSFQAAGWAHFNSMWTATTAPINYPVIGVGEMGFPGVTGCSHWQNIQTSQGFKSNHKGGVNFVFADGSVHFLQEYIDYLTFQRLGDRRDGQAGVTDPYPY